MTKYDAWLSHNPADDQADAYEEFCERFDHDPSEDHWEAFHEWIEGGIEDEQERRAEEKAEREVDYGD